MCILGFSQLVLKMGVFDLDFKVIWPFDSEFQETAFDISLVYWSRPAVRCSTSQHPLVDVCTVLFCFQWGGVWFLQWPDDPDKSKTSERKHVQWIFSNFPIVRICYGEWFDDFQTQLNPVLHVSWWICSPSLLPIIFSISIRYIAWYFSSIYSRTPL